MRKAMYERTAELVDAPERDFMARSFKPEPMSTQGVQQDRLFSHAEAATSLHMSARRLAQLRRTETGPSFIKVGSAYAYTGASLVDWCVAVAVEITRRRDRSDGLLY